MMSMFFFVVMFMVSLLYVLLKYLLIYIGIGMLVQIYYAS